MAQQTQQEQPPLRPTPDKRFQQNREEVAPRPEQLTIPRHQHQEREVNQEPPPSAEMLFKITEYNTRKFADELAKHLSFKDHNRDAESILRNTDDRAVVLGRLISKTEPYEEVRIAFPVESLSSQSSSVRSLFEGESSSLNQNVTLKFEVNGCLTKEDLDVAQISPDTALVEKLMKTENELILNRSTPPRSKNITDPVKYKQAYFEDMALPQGGYVQITSGSVKFTDPRSGEIKTLELSDCRLYDPEIRSLNRR